MKFSIGLLILHQGVRSTFIPVYSAGQDQAYGGMINGIPNEARNERRYGFNDVIQRDSRQHGAEK